MLKQSISILGLYLHDNTIFDQMILPEGLEAERADIINNLLLECSELELLYPDWQNMYNFIGIWSKSEKWAWQHLLDLYNAEYNPIWNKDGTIIETETRNLEFSGSKSDSVSGSNSENGQNINSVKGYNNDTWAESEKDNTTNSGQFQSAGSENSSDTEEGTITRERRETGNIGVTTTQFMFNEELDLIRRFNLYNEIAKSFKKRFCLMIY